MPCRRQRRRLAFEPGAQFHQVDQRVVDGLQGVGEEHFERGRAQFPHHRAAPVEDLDDAETAQVPQRLAHHRSADAQQFSELCLGRQAAPRLQLLGPDMLEQCRRSPISKRGIVEAAQGWRKRFHGSENRSARQYPSICLTA